MRDTAARAVRHLLNWRSLRWKIAALVTVASCAVALAVGLLVHRSTYERSMNVGGGRAMTALYAELQNYRRTGSTFAAEPPETIPLPLRQQIDTAGDPVVWYDGHPDKPWMWAAVRLGDSPVAVRVDMGTDLRSRQALDRHIVIAALGTLAAVVPLAALAAELLNRRLRRVARTARRIAAGDLDARTTRRATAGGPAARAGGRGDEIAEISATVDSMADSLQARLLSEQRFTADVAHELRTPLMGLVTATELLPESAAAVLVRDRVQVVRSLVEDLLEISRLDAGAERADLRRVPLASVIEGTLARTGLTACLTVTGAPTAETDPRRLDRIVTNLLVNAHRHGRPPVEITVTGREITVHDHGPGFPPSLLAHGPQRFRTGTPERGQGHGLGLTIAQGQSRVIGATLVFANPPAGGATATLRL
ncbi:HAMP domain-containing sensor histidine kinase [Sphaerisporangium sp. B11E5]|uniref:sensor histidine kinase n=1 Tax=Sphaerisporangium sp. B11E5 TaxID=3153563 RepID=UPI00325E5E44